MTDSLVLSAIVWQGNLWSCFVRSCECVARIYARIGNNDKAFEWLGRMVAMQGPKMLQYIDTDLYEKIKSDSRWPVPAGLVNWNRSK